VAIREAEFDPADFVFDGCAPCDSARKQGSHIVFDEATEDDSVTVADEDALDRA
jgi:hypothetical protein